MLTGEIISHYISIEFNVCNLELMMVYVLFVELRDSYQVGGWWWWWWVVISPGMRMLILVITGYSHSCGTIIILAIITLQRSVMPRNN